MIGVVNDQNDLAFATRVAAWQPDAGPKAGIMVYAANNLKSYTDAVFNALVMPTGIPADSHPGAPRAFALLQNFPNPFNPATTIRFAVPRRSHVTLAVFNTLGQKVAELVHGEIEAGVTDVRFDAGNLASGVYFYRLAAAPVGLQEPVPGVAPGRPAGAFVETRRLLLLK